MNDLESQNLLPHVLVVDDDPDLANLLVLLLQGEGIDADVAHDGKTALESISEHTFDLVLMDIGLPDMDGFSAWRQMIAAQPEMKDVPLIFVTGSESIEHQVQGFELGAADFIKKPFDVTEMIARVSSKLRTKKKWDAAEEERELAKQRSHEELLRMSNAMDCASDAISIVDPEGAQIYQNDAFTSIFGFSLEDLQVDGGQRQLYREPGKWESILRTCKTSSSWKGEVETKTRGDQIIPVLCRANSVTDDDGRLIGTVFIYTDITERKRMENDLVFLAHHDAFTQLPNRRYFTDLVEKCVAKGKRGSPSVLIYIDLDNFKVVNDTAGHQLGDRLLLQTVSKIQENIRESDILGRIGGDEFGILMEDTSIELAIETSKKLIHFFEEFRLKEGENSFAIGLSIGICSIPEAVTSEEALAQADSACYEAKVRGGNQYEVYTQGTKEFYRLSKNASWSMRIKDAIKENRIELWAQPIVPIQPHRKKYFEVLLRMREHSGELVFPGTLIPAAEMFGSIRQLDHHVLKTAVKYLEQFPDLNLSINLSGRTVSDESFIAQIKEVLNSSTADPQQIILEVTESSMISNMGMAHSFLSEVKSYGVKIALDDFGAGFSSLSYLRDLPYDIIKIDGGFLRNVHNDLFNQTLVKSINDIAHTLDKSTVAEFVESQEIFDFVKSIGIDFVQGYLLGKPSPLATLIT